MNLLSLPYLLPALVFLGCCGLWFLNRRLSRAVSLGAIGLCYVVGAIALMCGHFHQVGHVKLQGVEVDLVDRRGNPLTIPIGGGENSGLNNPTEQHRVEGGPGTVLKAVSVPDAIEVPGYPGQAFLVRSGGGDLYIKPGAGYRGDLLVMAGERLLPVAGNYPRLEPLRDGDVIRCTAAGNSLEGEFTVAANSLNRKVSLQWQGAPNHPARDLPVMVALGTPTSPASFRCGAAISDKIYLRGLGPDGKGAVVIENDGQSIGINGGPKLPLEPGQSLTIGTPGSPASGVLQVDQIIPVAKPVIAPDSRVGGALTASDKSREEEEISAQDDKVSAGYIRLLWSPCLQTTYNLENRKFALPMVEREIGIFTRLDWNRRVYALANAVGFAADRFSCIVSGPDHKDLNGSHLLIADPNLSLWRNGEAVDSSKNSSADQTDSDGWLRIPQGVPISFRQIAFAETPGLPDAVRQPTQPATVINLDRVRTKRTLGGFRLARPVTENSPPYVEIDFARPEVVAIDMSDISEANPTSDGSGRTIRFSINDPMEFANRSHKVRFTSLSPWFENANAEVEMLPTGLSISDDRGRDRQVGFGEPFEIGRGSRLALTIDRTGAPLQAIVKLLLAGLIAVVVSSWLMRHFPFFALFFGVAFLTMTRVLSGHAAGVNYPHDTGALSVALWIALAFPPLLAAVIFVCAGLRPVILGRVANAFTDGVKYRRLALLAIALLALRCLIAFVFGGKESINLGMRFSLSILFVPAHLALFAAAVSRLLADRRRSGHLTAKALFGFALFAAFALGLQAIAGAVVSDLGTFIYFIPPAVALAVVALMAWGETVTAYMGRSSDRDVAGRWRPAVVAMGLLIPAVGIALAIQSPLKLIEFFPGIHSRLMSDSVITERNLLRALQVIDAEKLVEMGTDTAEAIAQDHAYVANYAHRGLSGDGFLQVDVVRAKRETALNDNAFAVFTLAQFGSIGGIAMAIGYLAIMLGCILPRHSRGLGHETSYPLILALLAGLAFAFTSFYMMGANYSLTPFTGRNLYLQGLNSKSDAIESFLLLAMIAGGIGLALPERTRIRDTERSKPDPDRAERRLNLRRPSPAGWVDPFLAAGILAAVVAFSLVMKFVEGGASEPDDLYIARGYITKVRNLVERPGSPLKYASPATIKPEDQPPGGMGQLRFETGDATKEELAFYRASGRIRRDIAAFNDTGGGMFRVRRGALGIDPYSHNVLIDTNRNEQLDVTLGFDSDPVLALANNSISLGFDLATAEESIADPSLRSAAKAVPYTNLIGRERRAFINQAYVLLAPRGSETRTLAQLAVIDGSPTIRCNTRRENAVLFINNIAVNRGPQPGLDSLKKRAPELEVNTYQLVEGDRIRLQTPTEDIYFRFARVDNSVISQTRMLNGRMIREINPAVAERLPMVADLDAALRNYVRDHPDRRIPKSPRITLSIDERLQSVTQTALLEFVATYDRQHLVTLPDIQSHPAAIAMVDAQTGDALSLASYPTPDQIAELRRASERGTIERIPEGRFTRLEQNQNLPYIIIGSTSKPLFAAAIWETHPKLRNLRVDGGDLATHIYGNRLINPLRNVSRGNSWGPIEFLQHSSNIYTAHLYFATLAPQNSYWVDGRGYLQYEGAKLNISNYANTPSDTVKNLDDPKLIAHDMLRRTFDIDTVEDYSAADDALHERGFLAPLLKEIGVPPDELPDAFLRVSPDRPNLYLDDLKYARGGLISMLIGGASNRWSNVKLAEAYARLGSGRQVIARLAKDPSITVGPPAFLPLPISDPVRLQVLTGMEQAILSGTASSSHRGFRPAIEQANRELASQGLRIRAFGKTGTGTRIKGRECAAFAFFLGIETVQGQDLGGMSCTIYLEDRAPGGNSGNAVTLAGRIAPEMIEYLKRKKAVQEYLEAR